MFSIEMTSTGLVIDKNANNISKVTIVGLDNIIIDANKRFLSLVDGSALYYNNTLYMYLDKELLNSDGMPIPGFVSKKDVLEFLKEHKELITTCSGSKQTITYRDFKLAYNLLADCTLNSRLMHNMCEYLESSVMYMNHIESNFVSRDSLGISDHISLASDMANVYDLFSEFVVHEYGIEDNDFLDSVDTCIGVLLSKVYKMLDETSFCSLSFAMASNALKITEFESPSARRYILNCSIKDDEVMQEEEFKYD